MTDDKDQQNYYRKIAQRLFQLRGAPFVISPQENEFIRAWEEMRIPLRVILEGMEAAYEKCPPGMKKKLKLVHCQKWVMIRFKQHRERRIGTQSAALSTRRKRKEQAALEEAKKFFHRIPKEARFLDKIFSRTVQELENGPVNEKVMENRDKEVDQLIWKNISPERKKQLAEEIKKEWGLSSGKELSRLIHLKAVKSFRDKHHIPHLSLYYY